MMGPQRDQADFSCCKAENDPKRFCSPAYTQSSVLEPFYCEHIKVFCFHQTVLTSVLLLSQIHRRNQQEARRSRLVNA